ncbi:F-box protein At3g07870-like [Aegilops tauschii subsp. strangulata]|uniref:F-box protein At3g07870-like n=1 Tax=Aegilops tauschii subsp. strangulata TaxID=200361 RepID=UPI000844FCC9|nr:putative F-box protein At1g46984 [Aegilops tauschii subsp. strangulata]
MAAKRPNTVCLPQDVLASILVRLPGSDLRRLRGVCKEWRDIIADHTFIQAHMMHGPRAPLTHTIVFFPGFTYGSRKNPCNGHGFLFDEHWRLTAELIAGVWDDFVGACNGLLCFLEASQGSIKVVEPFTGESLVLPLPPEASGLRWTVNCGAYCFGYDATTRQFKIVHHDFLEDGALPLRAGEAIEDEELHVYTIGGGEGWRRLHVAFSVYGRAYGDLVYHQGSVYWPTCGREVNGRDEKLVRFDLATEKIMLVAAKHLRPPPEFQGRPKTVKFYRPADSTSCVITYGRCCEWDAWFPGAEEASLPEGCVLLDEGFDPGLYLCTNERSLVFGQRELLFEVGKDQPRERDHKYDGPTLFVPVPAHRRHQRLPIAGAPPHEQYYARTFGYAPTVSAAPLALYLGTPSP